MLSAVVPVAGMSLVLCTKVVFRCGTVVGHRLVLVCGETTSVLKLSLGVGGHIHTSLTYLDVLWDGHSLVRVITVSELLKTLASVSRAAVVLLEANTSMSAR